MSCRTVAPILLCVALTGGCVGPGLQGVQPYVTELDEARVAINQGALPSPRYLEAAKWPSTLRRVEDRIGDAAVSMCARAGGVNCHRVRQRAAIIRDQSINAWVDQDLRIGVHSGLLTHAGSDEEIAAVLAHEYGHIFAGHFDRSATNTGVGAIAGLIAGIAMVSSGYGDGNTVYDLTTLGYKAGAGAFSQQYELEADYYAALILSEADIHYSHGSDLLRRLARTSQGSSSAGTWRDKARLMASTHPANDFRLARWIGVSRTLEEGKRVSPNGIDQELRLNALWSLLVTYPWERGILTRWINPRTGNSGEIKLLNRKGMPECAHSGKYFAECAAYRNTEHRQGESHAETRYACAVPGVAQGSWTTDDGWSWVWVSLGTLNPWVRGEACAEAKGRVQELALTRPR